MKRTARTVLFVITLLNLGTAISAQIKTAHYEIVIPAGTADLLSSEMEQRFTEYNKLFRFDPTALSSPLRVRVFIDKNEYDSYVIAALGSEKPGAVYIHYQNPANRELVIHRGSAQEESHVPHQAFIQFLRAFITNPPTWLREGFAVYFSSLKFDREKGTLAYEENLSWLETVKRSAINPETVLSSGDSFPNMQAFSWAMVSFFMANKNSAYYRSLTDSFMVLSPNASAEENVQSMYKRLVLFHPVPELTRDYTMYIAGKKTFLELVEEGTQAYRIRNFAIAEESFRKSTELRNNHYAPYYFLGLLAYENKKYNDADRFYKTALDMAMSFPGATEKAMVMYARGVNAAAAGKKNEAIAFLQEAAATDNARYGDRSNELIRKLQ